MKTHENRALFSRALLKATTCLFLTAGAGVSSVWATPETTESMRTEMVQQQTVTVSGVVKDRKGEPIIGANIMEKGTTNGTTRAQYFPEAACEPAGTNSCIDGIEKMLEDLMSGEWDVQKRKTLRNRFKNRYGLYNLIYYKEIEATNGENNKSGNHLEQNPVWNKSLYDD